MVLGGIRTKNKNPSIKETKARTAAKMALIPSSSKASALSKKHQPIQTASPGESDSEINDIQSILQDSAASPALLRQFEKMLNKALRQTSEHITKSLKKEIRELGSHTEALETRVDEIEITTQEYMYELDNLKEENIALQQN